MKAVLGPDLAETNTNRHHFRGSPTSQRSLQPLMQTLHDNSTKTWVAGHLLNCDFGGKGDEDKNLTPLTSAANSAHKAFESHIKKMLLKCHTIDKDRPDLDRWYGVLYEVEVSSDPYAEIRRTDDLHSYCFSHLTLTYRFIALPKSDALGTSYNEVKPNDPMIGKLQSTGGPIYGAGGNIQNFQTGAGNKISVEVHNEA